jgi:cell wall assembly regulator SMI1
MGPDGTIIQVRPDDLTDDGIYNQVVVTGQDTAQNPIYADSKLTAGPLRYGGPFGRIPYKASSQFLVTLAQAQAYADALLPQVSGLRAATYVITCVPDPRREVGDVIPFQKDDEDLVGRITKLALADSGPMTLTVQVQS